MLQLHYFKIIPNQITAVRVLITLVLWGMIMAGISEYIGIGLVICFASDMMDGQLARRLHQETVFGARFDALADNFLIPSVLIWLLMFKREVYLDHIGLLSLSIMIYITSLVICRFRQKYNSSQLYLSKLSGLTQYIFGMQAFMASHYSAELFYFMMVIFLVSSLESLILQFSKAEVNVHLTSIIFTWPKFKRSKWGTSLINFSSRLAGFVYGADPETPRIADVH
jgi:phosphatidylglycerophosphate synthase